MLDVEAGLSAAVKHFWVIRKAQHKQQGSKTGRKDAGARGAVTGGKHADGFVKLIAAVCRDAGLRETQIHAREKKSRLLPGYYRPSKEWDLIVTSRKDLVAVVEVKSQVGSFGNNFNNRVEEALGNATDFWAAYRTGMYEPSQRPWLGYLFMLEETEKSKGKCAKCDHGACCSRNRASGTQNASPSRMLCVMPSMRRNSFGSFAAANSCSPW